MAAVPLDDVGKTNRGKDGILEMANDDILEILERTSLRTRIACTLATIAPNV